MCQKHYYFSQYLCQCFHDMFFHLQEKKKENDCYPIPTQVLQLIQRQLAPNGTQPTVCNKVVVVKVKSTKELITVRL